jgi:glutathione S-transferase
MHLLMSCVRKSLPIIQFSLRNQLPVVLRAKASLSSISNLTGSSRIGWHHKQGIRQSSTMTSLPDDKPMIIYAIMGSQYVFKVLAALQSKNIPHYVHVVPFLHSERRKVIPSGGLLVPELQVGLGGDRTIVSDSEKILEYFYEQKMLPHLYPSPLAHEVSKRASDGILAASVFYYNWVDPKGHDRSMRRVFGENLPFFVPWFLLDYVILSSTKAKFRKSVQNTIKDVDLDNEPAMRANLVNELLYFNSLLTSDQQLYLMEGASEPSAADFSVYALLERLVGSYHEPASDVLIYPAIPELLDETKDSHARLWQWHHRMRTNFKVAFKGHRVPKEMLSKL